MIKVDETVIEKHSAIQRLVKRVEELDSGGSVSTINRWESALNAIGFTNVNHEERVVYVCIHEDLEGRFYYDCDIDAEDPDEDVTIESKDNATVEEVLDKIQSFLIDLER